MSIPRMLVVCLCCLVGATTLLAASEPEAVSPGSATGTLIGHGCPTFSWSEVEGAESYKVVVYRVGEEGKEAEPVLQQTLGPALSWTPSLDSCLAAGRQYAWSVRAVGLRKESEWSQPSLFSVVEGPSEEEFEAALLLVREYLEGSQSLADKPANPYSGVQSASGPENRVRVAPREVTVDPTEPGAPTSPLPTPDTRLPSVPSVVSLLTDGAIGVGTSTPLADLHVVGDVSLGGMILAPNNTVNASSEILLAEEADAIRGMKIRYDGTTNNLEFWSYVSGNETGPWLTINRTNGVVGQVYRYKTAIETVTASTVFQSDDHIFFNVGTNERWTFEVLLWVSTSTSTGDFKFLWRGPTGSDVRSNIVAYEGNGVVRQANLLGMDTVQSVNYAAAASIQPIYMKGVFSTTDASGTITLQWAQVVASGTTRVYFPSQLEARRVVW